MIELKAKTREEMGKGKARQARVNGSIPAVLYGGKTHVMLTVDHKEAAAALRRLGKEQALISLTVEGGKKPGQFNVVVREVQRHFRDWKVQHIDFQKVDPEAVITLDIPVLPAGDWADQMGKGTVLIHRTLRLKGKAKNLPGAILVPVDKLEEGQKVAVKDLTIPAGVEVVLSPEAVVIQKA